MSTLLEDAHKKALAAAEDAVQKFCDQYFGGADGGACGFSWIEYYPVNKGNTRDGRAERRMMEKIGYCKDHTGKVWALWGPAARHLQSVDAKSAGASTYVRVMREELGITNIRACDRLD